MIKKKKKKDPNALKLRRVVSNNLFVLKTVHEVAPSYLPTYFLWSVGNAILDFLMSVWLLREIVNRYQLGRPASEVIGMLIALIVGQLVWWLIIDTLPQIVYPKYRQRIVERIQTGLFEKAAAVELECYENPEFYDKYTRATQVISSAYSKSAPIGKPNAILVTFIPIGFKSLAMYIAVASPSIVGLVAIIISLTSCAV